MSLPSWLTYYVDKKESFAGHFGWGAFIASMATIKIGSPWLGLLGAAIAGAAWEYGTYWLSEKQWKPAVLDMVPWAIGGLVALVMSVW